MRINPRKLRKRWFILARTSLDRDTVQIWTVTAVILGILRKKLSQLPLPIFCVYLFDLSCSQPPKDPGAAARRLTLSSAIAETTGFGSLRVPLLTLSFFKALKTFSATFCRLVKVPIWSSLSCGSHCSRGGQDILTRQHICLYTLSCCASPSLISLWIPFVQFSWRNCRMNAVCAPRLQFKSAVTK